MGKRSVLPMVWEVPQIFRDRLGDQVGRQRSMFADGHLLLVLHQPPEPDTAERRGRYFWRRPDGTWNSSDLGGGPQALNRHLDEYAAKLNKLEQQDSTADSAEEYFAVLHAVAPIHRSARNLHQTLQQAREMVSSDRDIINFRDRAYELERTAELLYHDSKNSLDFDMAVRAEEQAQNSFQMARSAHRLNLLAAFFFPVATLSAVFSMSLRSGLEETWVPLPFLGILAVGLVMGLILVAFVVKSAR